MLVCSFVCANRTRDRGCSKHPVFPAPSIFEEGQRRCKARAKRAARSRSRICVGWVERSETHHLLHLREALMGIASLHPSYGTEGGCRGAAVSKARRPAGTNLGGHGTRTSRLRKPPACLDFRQPDFPLVT